MTKDTKTVRQRTSYKPQHTTHNTQQTTNNTQYKIHKRRHTTYNTKQSKHKTQKTQSIITLHKQTYSITHKHPKPEKYSQTLTNKSIQKHLKKQYHKKNT